MNIYLVSQDSNQEPYDYYGMIVYANSEEEAKKIPIRDDSEDDATYWVTDEESMKVRLLGTAIEGAKSGLIIEITNHRLW